MAAVAAAAASTYISISYFEAIGEEVEQYEKESFLYLLVEHKKLNAACLQASEFNPLGCVKTYDKGVSKR